MTSEPGRVPVSSSPKAMKKFGGSRNQKKVNIYPVTVVVRELRTEIEFEDCKLRFESLILCI